MNHADMLLDQMVAKAKESNDTFEMLVLTLTATIAKRPENESVLIDLLAAALLRLAK